ncbi:complement decay-accelerating factor-like [Rissa tridactyla]|uniref:complement decay-accelerating factor-like n=1 Tax=Rissa tridactyla TaxID=75485 RepID=UPI0023BADA3D|nr:complement decay-accelerating factor-like [Rissa tridactyla]
MPASLLHTMPAFLHGLGQLLAVVVLVLQPAGSLEGQCPVPAIAHGQLKPAQNFTYGSTATLKCDAGYVPTGATTLQCLSNGRWHSRMPTCVLGRCPYPPAIDYADRSPQHTFPVGTTVTYSCRYGYTLLPNVSPVTTCLENFTWSVIPKLCQRVQCPSPTILHGRETSPRKAEYTVGHQVEFQCDPRYVLRGSQRIQCWADGTWRPPVPYCDKVCGPPPKITNGQHTGLRMEQFPYGTEVKYSCVEGLSLVGDESVYCTSDDGVNLTWSGPAPECRRESFLPDGLRLEPGAGYDAGAKPQPRYLPWSRSSKPNAQAAPPAPARRSQHHELLSNPRDWWGLPGGGCRQLRISSLECKSDAESMGKSGSAPPDLVPRCPRGRAAAKAPPALSPQWSGAPSPQWRGPG